MSANPLLTREADARAFRLIGIGAYDLIEAGRVVQDDLFGAGPADNKIDEAFDAVRNKFGEDSIVNRWITCPTCSWTASPSASAPDRGASRCWRPGASPLDSLPCGFLHTMACDLFTRLELPVSGRRPPSSISGEG